jgi:hypothetical protein
MGGTGLRRTTTRIRPAHSQTTRPSTETSLMTRMGAPRYPEVPSADRPEKQSHEWLSLQRRFQLTLTVSSAEVPGTVYSHWNGPPLQESIFSPGANVSHVLPC